MLKKDDVLYFIHIPKTAGLTLIYILNNFFDYSSILIEHSWDQLLPKPPKDFSKYRFVRGHFGYGFYRHFPKKPIFITMLRKPIEHTISNLEMHLHDPKLRSQYDISRGMGITEMVESKLVPNFQTLFLAVDIDVLERIKSINLKNYQEFTLANLAEYIDPDISTKELEIAKTRLSEFAFFGLTEKFDESVLLLCHTFDWLPIKIKVKINVAKKRLKQKDLPEKTIDLIKSKTALDSELYAFGERLFEERYLDMVDKLRAENNIETSNTLPQAVIVYDWLKESYITKHGRLRFLKETLLFNMRKINFVARYVLNHRFRPILSK